MIHIVSQIDYILCQQIQIRTLIVARPNKMLYKERQEEPLSLTILRLQWQLFGQILRLQNETPEAKAMSLYYKTSEEHQEKQLSPRCLKLLKEHLQQHQNLN